MTAASVTMGKFIAAIVIGIIASSVISIGVSTQLMIGPNLSDISEGKGDDKDNRNK